jgi:curved DNA-binding protein CbpA
MTRMDPFAELGLDRDASPAAVKAAWRRLARTHHPDVATDAPDTRAATRRMARINAAYEAALSEAKARRGGRAHPAEEGAPRASDGPAPADGGGGRRHGDADPAGDRRGASRPPRPVTRRVDTSGVYAASGATGSGRRAGGDLLSGHPPRPAERPGPEELRGAPSGPLERHHPARPPRMRLPDPETARALTLTFGKFHDRTLGDVERDEPTYVDWIVRTIRRDPEVVAAARAIQRARPREEGVSGGGAREGGAAGAAR